MRGKKIDTQFLHDFIYESITLGYDTDRDIFDRAKYIISEIDQEIKNVELRKIERSKLLGVVESLEINSKYINKEEVKILPFYKISYPDICKKICLSLKEEPLLSSDIMDNGLNLDAVFCIKQMIEFKIIAKVGDYLVRGDMFEEYLNFLQK